MPEARGRAVAGFAARFGGPPELVVRSPGRVNLIGDHTDYNDGFVLPMAIDREVALAVRRRRDRAVVVSSEGFVETRFDLDAIDHDGPGWSEYVAGVAWSLRLAGIDLVGWEGVMASDVPVGAGLSSSAALELAVARAFVSLADMGWDPVAMALAAQRAENEWVGMACGIMDQLVIASARAGSALLIDCRTLQTDPVTVPDGLGVLVVDSGTRRDLVGSAYNERRAACDAAARAMGVPALRDAAMSDLATLADGDPVTLRRARHVITENARVLELAGRLAAGDAAAAGRIMTDGHASLRDDFEVSTPAIDALVELAAAQPGCHGARITGAGFGGCIVALVDADAVATVGRSVVSAAAAEGPHPVAAFPVLPAAGVSVAGGT